MAKRRTRTTPIVETAEALVSDTIEDVIDDTVETVEEVKISKPMVLKSLRDNVLSIGMVTIPSRGEITLSENDKKNENTMKRINHAIKIGLIKEV
jgi:hypothetical protein